MTIVAAISLNNGIGYNGGLPWNIKSDLIRFKKLTINNTVIMGRKTFQSIGRELPNRHNIVISRSGDVDCKNVCRSLDEALTKSVGIPYIIGGSEIYKLAIEEADSMIITRVRAEVKADTFFPIIPDSWKLFSIEHVDRHSCDSHDTVIEKWIRLK